MKLPKRIPMWLTIDILIIVAGLALITLGIVTTSTRINGMPI